MSSVDLRTALDPNRGPLKAVTLTRHKAKKIIVGNMVNWRSFFFLDM